MRKTLLLTVLTAGLMTGSAEDALARYTAIGAGLDSCGTWTSDRRSPWSADAMQEEQWVLGFLTAIGYTGNTNPGAEGNQNPLKGMDANGVWAWIDNYCRVNPIERIEDAAAAFNNVHPS
jgi:hypothetical protein